MSTMDSELHSVLQIHRIFSAISTCGSPSGGVHVAGPLLRAETRSH